MKITSAASAAGHVVAIGLVVVFSGLQRKPVPVIPVQLVFTPPPEPVAAAEASHEPQKAPNEPPFSAPEPVPPTAAEAPHPPELAAAVENPRRRPKSAAAVEPLVSPPQRPKPIYKPRPQPPQLVPEAPAERTTVAPAPVLAVPGPPQIAAVPRPPPPSSATPAAIGSQYRSLLAGWLDGHKRYPENARQRGEQGRAVLRFRVDRTGRVLDYAVIGSTSFPDLDSAVEAMMRTANMPPFPSGMTETEIEVTVAIQFSLTR